MTVILLMVIMFGAAFVQSIAGFGGALFAMPLLIGLIGLQTASPTVAIIGLVSIAVILFRYRRALNFRAVWPMVVASFITTPVGVWGVRYIDEGIATAMLGLVVLGFALYALFELQLPKLVHPAWAVVAGLFSGLVSGAFNTAGPPVIIYANCRRWPPDEFKSNLQAFFLFSTSFLVLSHVVAGNVTPQVLQFAAFGIPANLVALAFGFYVSDRIQPAVFRKVALGLLVLLGISLMF